MVLQPFAGWTEFSIVVDLRDASINRSRNPLFRLGDIQVVVARSVIIEVLFAAFVLLLRSPTVFQRSLNDGSEREFLLSVLLRDIVKGLPHDLVMVAADLPFPLCGPLAVDSTCLFALVELSPEDDANMTPQVAVIRRNDFKHSADLLKVVLV